MSERKNKKPDDFDLAIDALESAWEAFSHYSKDLAKAQVDLRVLSKTTTELIEAAAKQRKKLAIRLQIAEAEMIEQEGHKH